MDLSNITLNGEALTSALVSNLHSRPSRQYVSEEEKLMRAVRVHTTTKRWNSSRSRSGKCRIVMANGVFVGKVGTA
jgi:hypothetical protein